MLSAPQTGNRYAYGLANPLRYTDPSGRFVNKILLNPGAWLGLISILPPTAVIGIAYSLFVAISGYDPLTSQQVSGDVRMVNAIFAAAGIFGKIAGIFRDAWAGTEVGGGLGTLGRLEGDLANAGRFERGFGAEAGAAERIGQRGLAQEAGPTVGDLRAAGRTDAHHIIQDAAVRDVSGYRTNEAPGIQLGGPSTLAGSAHFGATQVQRAAGVGGTYGAERQVAAMALRAAGLSETEVARAVARADAYFIERLGMTFDFPLRIPGNRKIP